MTGGAQAPTTRVLRSTRQRAAVSALLDRLDDFRSAQEIHEELRRTGEGIGLTTVYRTLQTLADGGEVDVLRTGTGEAVYRRCATADHHHHLVCRRCGAHRGDRRPGRRELGDAGGRGARVLRAQPHRRDLRALPGVRRRA